MATLHTEAARYHIERIAFLVRSGSMRFDRESTRKATHAFQRGLLTDVRRAYHTFSRAARLAGSYRNHE